MHRKVYMYNFCWIIWENVADVIILYPLTESQCSNQAIQHGEGGSKGRGPMFTYGWFMLMFGRNNSIKQLSFNLKINLKKNKFNIDTLRLFYHSSTYSPCSSFTLVSITVFITSFIFWLKTQHSSNCFQSPFI